MPAKPRWHADLNKIRTSITSLPSPFLDRPAIEKLFGVKLAFRADLNYHVENFKVINAVTGEEYR